jgi:hypothetical protein
MPTQGRQSLRCEDTWVAMPVQPCNESRPNKRGVGLPQRRAQTWRCRMWGAQAIGSWPWKPMPSSWVGLPAGPTRGRGVMVEALAWRRGVGTIAAWV